MVSNIKKSEFAEAAMLGFSLSEATITDPQELRKRHRSHLQKRFLSGGTESIADFELLELILFRALPHHDVQALCKTLLEEFESFNGVISATENKLKKVKGVTQSVVNELKVVQAAAHKLAQLQVLDKDVLTTWDQLIAYCRSKMVHLNEEQFRVLFLDSKNMLISDQCLQTGVVNHVPVYPRQIAKHALELDASAVILVHNHPSGDPEPSPADITVTHEIIDALEALSITVHDHVIVGKSGNTSFRSSGLI